MVWTLGLMSGLVVIALALGVVGEAAVTRRHVATVADLAAVAAAQASSGCAVAVQVAQANDVLLDACAVDGSGDVRVLARVGPPPLARRLADVLGAAPWGDVTAEARAGPP